jgi:hypothetical protein
LCETKPISGGGGLARQSVASGDAQGTVRNKAKLGEGGGSGSGRANVTRAARGQRLAPQCGMAPPRGRWPIMQNKANSRCHP